jgi:hypothetical protein
MNFGSTGMNYCFLDFETNVAGTFYLAAYSFGPETIQVVLNESLSGLAKHHNMRVIAPEDFARELLIDCLKNGSTLVAYSIAERNTLDSLLDANFKKQISAVGYLNLKIAAKAWCNRHYYADIRALPPLTANSFVGDMWSLASVMRLTDFPPAGDYNIGQTTQRFNAVIAGLNAKHQNYAGLTRVQKTKATKALKHNRYDVDAMIHLLNTIKSEAPDLLTRQNVLSPLGAS